MLEQILVKSVVAVSPHIGVVWEGEWDVSSGVVLFEIMWSITLVLLLSAVFRLHLFFFYRNVRAQVPPSEKEREHQNYIVSIDIHLICIEVIKLIKEIVRVQMMWFVREESLLGSALNGGCHTIPSFLFLSSFGDDGGRRL
ncbi:hypothetical protein TNCV_4656071 [Trichonephila clavipes]|nr:hypothetical protein TNCV_4656071 [Trichonephila clavipes]